MNDLYIVSVEDATGRYWTCCDDLDHLGPWIVRTLQRVTDKTHGSPGAYYQPRVTQFAKLS